MATFGVNVAIVSGSKVLLTLREDFEVWCLPGGHVEDGESLVDAAVREVKEETGLEIELGRLVGLYSRPHWEGGPTHVATFAAAQAGGSLLLPQDEVLEAGWFGVDELPEALLLGQRLRILDALAGRTGVVRTSEVTFPYDSVEALFDARDASDLGRAAFYMEYVFRPNEHVEREELATEGSAAVVAALEAPRPGCVFCDRTALREADVYLENEWCVYASSRDPRDPPGVLPGSGVIVPKAHRASPFDLTREEWAATHELLVAAKDMQDDRWAPDGYFLSWTSFPASDDEVPDMHAHLHVVPRFDDEPRRDAGGRVGIKGEDNLRPDPAAPGTGRARNLGPAGG